MAKGQVVTECVQRLWQVDPHPSPLLPPVSLYNLQWVHKHALVRKNFKSSKAEQIKFFVTKDTKNFK